MKQHFWKRGDNVFFTTGKYKGEDGTVVRVLGKLLAVVICDVDISFTKMTIVNPNEVYVFTCTFGGKG